MISFFVIAIYIILLLSQNFTDWSKLLNYSKTGPVVTVHDFQNFLTTEQQDPLGNNEIEVSCFIRDYLQDPQRDVQEPHFTFSEFIDFLFSKQNSVWDTKYSRIYQDMNKPLTHYWIASSHNT